MKLTNTWLAEIGKDMDELQITNENIEEQVFLAK